MTATVRSADAPFGRHANWKSINWKQVRDEVRRLQVRIAKAVRNHIGIVRHRKIRGRANPFDPEYFEYFRKRSVNTTYGQRARLTGAFV